MNDDLSSLFEDINDERELKSTQKATKKKNSKAKSSNEVRLEEENASQTRKNEKEEILITTKLKIVNKFVKCYVYDAEKHEEFMT
jgi:hypothetical protein